MDLFLWPNWLLIYSKGMTRSERKLGEIRYERLIQAHILLGRYDRLIQPHIRLGRVVLFILKGSLINDQTIAVMSKPFN